jgi:hypothetical protein
MSPVKNGDRDVWNLPAETSACRHPIRCQSPLGSAHNPILPARAHLHTLFCTCMLRLRAVKFIYISLSQGSAMTLWEAIGGSDEGKR